MQAPGISYQNVYKSYGGVWAVSGVSFHVNWGELVVLLGPNGSGKSTLFKMALGIVKPDYGQVFVAGVDAAANPLEARRIVGYVPEENVVYESLKVDEYLSFILSVYGVRPDREMIERVVELLGLREHAGKLVGELSHGNKRKVLLASVMLREPRVLILDEVFNGLDAASARIVKAWMREAVRRGAAVLVSTHVLPIAEAIADRIVIIHRGKVVAQGRPGELKQLFGAAELEDVYLELTGYSRELDELVKALYE